MKSRKKATKAAPRASKRKAAPKPAPATADNTPQDKIALKGKELFALKAKKDKLEEDLKKVNESIRKLATEELAKLMEDGEIEKLSIKGRGTVYLSNEVYVNVLKDDRPALYKWLRDNNMGDIVVDFVFPQTLTSLVKELREKNLPLPTVKEGDNERPLVKATDIPTAKTRKGN